MDESLRKVTDEFITERVSYHGRNEAKAVNDAFMELRAKVERLHETLNDEQLLLLRTAENAYRVADGETQQFYYKAGFGDAIHFLMSWSES